MARQLRLKFTDRVLTATLNDSLTAQDFATLLPLSLTLEDYAGTELISALPRSLSTEGTPAGSDPAVGDVAYYAPWGNLAIFYRDSGYASGLIILGKIAGNIIVLQAPRPLKLNIELIDGESE